jgi:hypothetical protein
MKIAHIKKGKQFLQRISQKISFVIKIVWNHAVLNNMYNYTVSQNSEYKAAFAFIDVYNEITNFSVKIISDIVERKAILHKRQEELDDILAATNKNLNDYISFQKNEYSQLTTKKNQCEEVFKNLEQTATRFNNSFLTLNKKLEHSAKSIQYCGESETLINDINTSFRSAYNKNNEEIMQNIERILSTLNSLAYKCSSMQSFPKSYNNAISMYSGKIANILQTFEKKIIVLAKIYKIHDNSNITSKNTNISNKSVSPRRKKFCSKCGTKIENAHTVCPQCNSSIYVEEL